MSFKIVGYYYKSHLEEHKKCKLLHIAGYKKSSTLRTANKIKLKYIKKEPVSELIKIKKHSVRVVKNEVG